MSQVNFHARLVRRTVLDEPNLVSAAGLVRVAASGVPTVNVCEIAGFDAAAGYSVMR